jgi:transcriptional regulator with PAS, ATPase and Fis domain
MTNEVVADVLTHTIAARPGSLRLRAATLRILAGPDAGRTARIEQPTFVVGGGDSADLHLTDRGVSREHVRFSLDPRGIRVRDQGSKNGTFIGGMRVSDVLLTEGATLTIAGTTLAIELEGDPIVLPLSSSYRFEKVIGTSTVMRHLFATLERAAATDLSILLEGESGVGKDLLAESIHAKSARSEHPFVVVDCGAISPQLLESELFGHERGAFTGAEHAHKGAFLKASRGTLFLDEIGELPIDLQPKLLRVLEAREVRALGSSGPRKIDVRIIAATNRKLAEAATMGTFRSDLFYRLAVMRVSVPPLRERPEDILPIARSFLRSARGDLLADFPADFASMLTSHRWPGNVRELRNVVQRFAVFGAEMLSPLEGEGAGVAQSEDDRLAQLPYAKAKRIVMSRFEDEYLPRVLARADGVVSRAADLAGVGRPSFYRMLERSSFAKDPPKG